MMGRIGVFVLKAFFAFLTFLARFGRSKQSSRITKTPTQPPGASEESCTPIPDEDLIEVDVTVALPRHARNTDIEKALCRRQTPVCRSRFVQTNEKGIRVFRCAIRRTQQEMAKVSIVGILNKFGGHNTEITPR
jgi:hypothetical protein